MLAKPLRNFSTLNKNTAGGQEKSYLYEITNKGYGKDAVKVVHVTRDGPVHTMQELEVCTHLKLSNNKEYILGNNLDIVDSDAMKNTIYLLAKKHSIENNEKFALILGKHFLQTYSHVEEAHVHVEAYPWKRIRQDDEEHNHAFVYAPMAQYYCDVIVKRSDPEETVMSGIKGLRVLKTTQSSFVNFVDDAYRVTPDQHDRILSTSVECSWQYSSTKSIDFVNVSKTVKDIILKNFAGDPKVGKLSTSLQNNIYHTEKSILDVLPQLSVISMTMLNLATLSFDTKPFQQLVPGDNDSVFVPVEKPYSAVHGELTRKDLLT